jgi:hypothetical protein
MAAGGLDRMISKLLDAEALSRAASPPRSGCTLDKASGVQTNAIMRSRPGTAVLVAYIRSTDRRRMVQVAPHQYVSLSAGRKLGLFARARRKPGRT